MRDREKSLEEKKRQKSEARKCEDIHYERDRKRRYRESVKDGIEKKKGRKETVGLKQMSKVERREYFRDMKRMRRQKLKLVESERRVVTVEPVVADGMESRHLDSRNSSDEDIDFNKENIESAAIMNIIKPHRKNVTEHACQEHVEGIMKKLDLFEILDVITVLAHALPEPVKLCLKTKGVSILRIPRSAKRIEFSTMSKSTKHRCKDNIINEMKRYTDEVAANVFRKKLMSTIGIWFEKRNVLSNRCGISVEDHLLPMSYRVSESVSGVTESLGNNKEASKVVEVTLISETIRRCSDAIDERGLVQAVAKSFNTSRKKVCRIMEGTKEGKTISEMVERKRTDIGDTEWPEKIKSFCLTKPICREAPGETVSVAYGQREPKYIRQFPVSEIFNYFILKFPEFNYKLSTFRKYVPKNLVAPTLRDVKQNVCPIHENVKRSVKAYNRFLLKNKAKHLQLTTSTIDTCLQFICNLNPENKEDNRNPLNWSPVCTKGECLKCGGKSWLNTQLKHLITQKITGNVAYSLWISEREGKKTTQTLRKLHLEVKEFVNKVLGLALVEVKFPEHLRKAWMQWKITKQGLVVIGNNPNDVALRTREDYQENIKFLCTSETVSTHRGVGVVTMVA